MTWTLALTWLLPGAIVILALMIVVEIMIESAEVNIEPLPLRVPAFASWQEVMMQLDHTAGRDHPGQP